MSVNDKLHEIAYTYKLFKTIDEKRKNIYKQNKSCKKQIQDKDMTKEDRFMKYVLENTTYKNTVKKIFKLMKKYNFEDTPSVKKNYDMHLVNRFKNYDKLTKVDLFAHTLNVCHEVITFTTPTNVKNINILLALFHDFGKSRAIEKELKIEQNMSHEKISAMYAKKMLENEVYIGNREINADLVETISRTIEIQHSSYYAQKNSFLHFLREADKNARVKELQLIELIEKDKT